MKEKERKRRVGTLRNSARTHTRRQGVDLRTGSGQEANEEGTRARHDRPFVVCCVDNFADIIQINQLPANAGQWEVRDGDQGGFHSRPSLSFVV